MIANDFENKIRFMILHVSEKLLKEILFTKELSSVEKLLYLQILFLSLQEDKKFQNFAIKIYMADLGKNLNMSANSVFMAKKNLEKKGFLNSKKTFNEQNVPEANIYTPSLSTQFLKSTLKRNKSKKTFLNLFQGTPLISISIKKIQALFKDKITHTRKVVILMLFIEAIKNKHLKIITKKKTLAKYFRIKVETLSFSLKAMQNSSRGIVSINPNKLFEITVEDFRVD